MNKGKRFLLIGSCALGILNSCTDNPGNLSPQVLPKSDIISAYQTDTTTVVTSMYLKDSVITNGANQSMLGSINDPVFGESKASIYAQVSPSGLTAIPWLSNAKVDSLVVLLPTLGIPYGNNDPQTFAVYQLANSIISAHAYYSDTTIKLYSKTPIGQAQVTPPNGISSNDTLRIKLSNAFMNYFINKAVQGAIVNGVPSYWSTNFDSVIQGIYIAPVNPLQLPGQGGISYINLISSFAGVYAYWHYLIPNDTEHAVEFPLGGSNFLYFNNFTHNYAASAIGASHPAGPRDSIAAPQFVYVQSMAGVMGRINFPNLHKNWSKLGNVAINEAEVTLPVDAQYISNSFAPFPQLDLLVTGSKGTEYYTPDQLSSVGNYGGSFGNNAYTFVITQYIQSIINGKNDSDRGLYIVPSNPATTAYRVVLYGAGHRSVPANKATLTIYYTPLKKN